MQATDTVREKHATQSTEAQPPGFLNRVQDNLSSFFCIYGKQPFGTSTVFLFNVTSKEEDHQMLSDLLKTNHYFEI